MNDIPLFKKYPQTRRILFEILIITFLFIIVLFSILNFKDCFSSFSEQKNNLTIIFLYPESQGQANLIVLPNGKSIMIDTGPRRLSDTIIETMNKYNLTKLDAVILSHKHPDHTTGINEALKKEKIELGKVYDSGVPHKKKSYDDPKRIDRIDEFFNLLQEKNIPLMRLRDGDNISLDPEVTIEILNPPDPILKIGDWISNNSIVVKLIYKNFSILFPGDIYSIVEEQLFGKNLNSDVLLLSHHGHKEASSKGFLKAVNPSVAIVSTTIDNPYEYPHKETSKRLDSLQIPLLEVNEYGTLTLSTDGDSYNIYAEYSKESDSKAKNKKVNGKIINIFGK